MENDPQITQTERECVRKGTGRLTEEGKATFKKRGPITAALLSFIAPGSGQAYNLQFRKAVCWSLSMPIWLVLSDRLGVRHRFSGLVVSGAVQLVIGILSARDAFASAQGPESPPPPNRNRSSRRWQRIGSAAVTCLCIAALDGEAIQLASTRMYVVPPDVEAMEPTILPGDRIAADMKAYAHRTPQRGDVVIVRSPPPEHELIMKRVIAVGGDEIQGTKGQMLLDGQTLNEPYAVQLGAGEPHDYSLDTFGPLTVPSNKYFLLGDNRDRSWDSRSFGTLELNAIRGKVLYVYWSKQKSRIGQEVK